MAIPGNLLAAATESMDPTIAGWQAVTNCTLSRGTGGRNGDGCLVVKSVSAGQMEARTSAMYSIAPGATYLAFADAAGVSAERIGIRWLTSAGAAVGSVTWSETTAGSSTGWHRVSVAGVAPPTAQLAQVVLWSSESGASVNHFWENVYLGPPIRTLGNLLPFNTESSEVDSSGWTPVVNSTVSRQVPPISWAVDNYLAGGHTLAMTASAAGNAACICVDRPAVTPGVEYLAYAYLQPPTVAAQAWIELRFFDAVGNEIQATRATLAPPTPATGMYRQRVSDTAPAGAVTCAVAAGLDGASAGQVLRLETVVITVAPQFAAGSLLPYAAASFEQGVAGWTVPAGVATLARTTPWGASGWDGAYALAVSSSTATSSTIISPKCPGVTPGQNHRAQVIVHPDAGAWTSVTVKVRWYDDSDTDLGASTGSAYSVPGSSWYLMTTDAEAPEDATQAAVELTVVASSTSSVLHVDQVALWQVLPLVAVEARSDAGYTVLTLRELLVDYQVSVYRVGADGMRTLVRGPSGLIDRQPILSDLMVIEDHEAPMGVPVSYRIEIYNASGALASTRTSDAVLLTLNRNEAWLKDPSNPQRNMRLLVAKAPDWQRPIEQSVFTVRGRRNKIVLSGRRQGLEGDLAVWTRSDAERDALHLLCDTGGTLLLQAAPGMGVNDMYVSAGQLTEARVSPLATEQWRAWDLPLVETDMPVAAGVNGARGRTWQDVVAEFAACADLLQVYATCEDLLLDRRM